MSFLKDFQTEVKILVGVLVIIVLIVGGFFLFFNNSQQQTEQTSQDVIPSEKEISEEISAVENSGVIQFSGEVLRGETFEKEISSNLVFRLVPRPQGWDIQVGNKTNPDLDFSRITLPLRGINTRQLNGWHFRNADNTGSNEGSVNAPQEIREFEFVVDQKDYDIGLDALTKLSWSYNYTVEEVVEASQLIYGGLKRGTGALTVTDMELGNLESNQKAWFEWIKFDVEIVPPLDMSEWKTYRSEEFGFELKYPLDWALYHRSKKINIRNEKEYIDWKDIYVEMTTNKERVAYITSGEAGESVTIGDVKWDRFLHNASNPGEYYDSRTTLALVASIHDRKYIVLLAPSEGFAIDPIFLPILSTFRFIELETTIDISSWQTYRNEELGFEVKYPKDWGLQAKQYSNAYNVYFGPMSESNVGNRIDVSIENNVDGISLTEYINSLPVRRPVKIISTKDITLAGILAKRILYTLTSVGPSGSLEEEYIYIITLNNDKIYTWSPRDSMREGQILSTFRFIE